MPEEKLSQEALSEWRAHPVTGFVLSVLSKAAEAEKRATMQEAWARRAFASLEDIGRIEAALQLIEDIKEATAEDWNEWYEYFRLEGV